MTIRIPPNRLSSRAEATGSFQIRPRVGHDEIPSPAWLYHRHPLTTFCPLLLLLFLFLSSSFLFTLLLICALFLSLLLSSISSHYLGVFLGPPVSLSAVFSLYQHLSMPIFCTPITALASCFLLSHGLFSWLPWSHPAQRPSLSFPLSFF